MFLHIRFTSLQAIALDGRAVNTNRAMDLVTRVGPNGTGGGANFIVGSVFNRVSRSKYGRRLPYNATRDVKQARSLAATTGES
jgi:structural maintenance of chromosomes protein 5